MRYVTISVICEGALDEEEDFFDYALAEAHLRTLQDEAESEGVELEVYVMDHYHRPEDHCECSQFVTDHHPTYVFPRDVAPMEDEHPLA